MCDPVTALIVGTVVSVAGRIDAAEDAEDAYHAQAASTAANAQHRRDIAEYNAGVFTEQAARLRNEMVGRLNEVSGVNIIRLTEDRTTNIERLETARDTNLERLKTAKGTDVGRLKKELSTITKRLTEARETDTGILETTRGIKLRRIEEALGLKSGRFNLVAEINKERLAEDIERLAIELNMDAVRDIDRLLEISEESVIRLGRRAKDVATIGFEKESDLREQVEQDVASQRSFYAAGNIIVNSGTPMRLQIDSRQQGEVQALRIRRDYRIQVQNLKDNASDNLRDALFQIEDIQTESIRRLTTAATDVRRETEDINNTLTFNLGELYRTSDIDTQNINRETDLRVTDINLKTTQGLEDIETRTGIAVEDIETLTDLKISDIELDASTRIGDIDRETDLRLEDVNRNLGYDLSDLEFEATKLDQQATLTMIQGDAELAAGLNRASALEDAGADAFTAGVIGAVGSGLTGVASAWYTSQSSANQAPVFESAAAFTQG